MVGHYVVFLLASPATVDSFLRTSTLYAHEKLCGIPHSNTSIYITAWSHTTSGHRGRRPVLAHHSLRQFRPS